MKISRVILFMFLLGYSQNLIAQDTTYVYQDDSTFFKEQDWRNLFEVLQDSLGSGHYIVYNVETRNKDKKRKRIVHECDYLNGSRNGILQHFIWSSKGELLATYSCDYSYGQKHGIEKTMLYNDKTEKLDRLAVYTEYSNGKKHGIHISFEQDVLVHVLRYEEGEIAEIIYSIYDECAYDYKFEMPENMGPYDVMEHLPAEPCDE